MMTINETIIHYIRCYSGSENRVVQKTVSKHIHSFKNRFEAENAVERCISDLLYYNYIQDVAFCDMDETERQYYSNDYCRIFRVIRSFNEAEYIEEKCKKLYSEAAGQDT